jgi:hypothetical protein
VGKSILCLRGTFNASARTLSMVISGGTSSLEVEFLEQVEARATEAKALASLCREICIDGQAAPERPARTHAPADMLPGQLRGFWMTWRDVILPASGLTEDGQRTVLSWIRDGVSWKEFQRSEDTGRMEDPAHAGVYHSMEGLTSTGQSVKEWLGIRIGEYRARGLVREWREDDGPAVINPVGCEPNKPRFVLTPAACFTPRFCARWFLAMLTPFFSSENCYTNLRDVDERSARC